MPYKPLGPKPLKPAVPVALVGPNGKQRAPALGLIDSGCDYSTFPKAWAAALGIDFDKDCEEIEGNTASGKDTTQRQYVNGVHGLILGHKVPLYAIFNPQIPIALLGREDFMAYFKVAIDQNSRRFQLEPY